MSVVAGPDIVSDGLVLLLDAGNIESYPGTGITWYDLSGNSNHCTWASLPAYNDTHFTLDGTQSGTIINNATLDFSSAQTLIMVLRHTYTSGRRNPWNQAYGGYGTWTHEQGNYINWYFGDYGGNGGSYVALGSGTTNRGAWNMLATVRDEAQRFWVVNGVQGTVYTHAYGTLTTTAANITIGSGYAGAWIGDMAVIMGYTTALTTPQVQQNFAALRGRFGL